MTAALFILAASCIFMAGLLLYVAVRHNALIEYQRELTRQYLNLEDENIDLKGKNLRKHVAMNRLARKCKQRGKTIETLERRIGIMNAQMLVTDDINARLAPQVDALKTEKGKLAIENGRLKVAKEELEKEVKDMQTSYNMLYERKKGLEALIAEADKKLIALAGEYETKVAKLKAEIEGLNSREICPYERMGGNRVVYCMKEKEKK